MPIRKSNADMLARMRHAKEWAKNDRWKDIKGGFNPDVFDDLDSDTRQRLRDSQVGPAHLKGDKLDAGSAFSVGHWSDGRHGTSNFFTDLRYGKGADQAHNRGSVQDAVWEMGLSGIGDKEQLNQFLDRTDALKAEHGDFLKDGWDPEDIMLYRNRPAAKEEQAPAPQEAAPAAPTQPSSQLLEARSRWDSIKDNGSIPFNPAGDGIRDAATYGNLATDDVANRFAPGLNDQAGLEGAEMEYSAAEQLNRFQGQPTELASSDIKDLYKYYSKQISGIA